MIGGAVGAAAALAAPALAIASNEAPSIAELIEKHRADARTDGATTLNCVAKPLARKRSPANPGRKSQG